MLNDTSNNTSSAHKQHKLAGEPGKSPFQAKLWVWITDIIAKHIIKDKQTRDIEINSTKASVRDFIFTRVCEQPKFPFKCHIEPTSWTASIIKTSKQGHVFLMFSLHSNFVIIWINPDVV